MSRNETVTADRVARQLAGDVNPLATHLANRYVGPAPLPPVAIVTATPRKLKWFELEQILKPVRELEDTSSLTRIWEHESGPVATLVHGVGGPSADRLLITAMMQGVRTFIRIGTCGLLEPGATIGTVVVAEEATSDDTTFQWYLDALERDGRPVRNKPFAAASTEYVDTAVNALPAELEQGRVVRGRAFSTSLIFREGPETAVHYRELGCAAADMEAGTVLASAQWYRLPAVALLVGRDHITEGGFHTDERERFAEGVQAIRTALDALIPVAQAAAARVASER
ncbi:phosphorylase family protein [Actinoplanes subglobosus]|uniref:Uridine phosphorylase n=1 Tax=Actinoplanes subglobosus TaxID=1547892 RepID=A0ABV8IPV2_9ACTN